MKHNLPTTVSKLLTPWSLARWGAAVLLLATGCAAAPAHHAPATAWAGKSSALDYYAEKCDAGAANECANAARVLLNPAGKYHNDPLALEFRTRACKANAYYCGDLGQMYMTGKGVQKDEQAGLSYLDRGCAAKNASACSTAQLAHLQAQADADRAKTLAAAPQPTSPTGAAQAKDDDATGKKAAIKKPAKSDKRTKRKSR